MGSREQTVLSHQRGKSISREGGVAWKQEARAGEGKLDKRDC